MPELPDSLPGGALLPADRIDQPPVGDVDLAPRLGRLAMRQIEALGLSDVARKIAASAPLAEDSLVAAAGASLPLLGKLVELAAHQPPPMEPPPVDLVIACPLGSLLQNRSVDLAIEEAAVVVAEQIEADASQGGLLVAMDDWAIDMAPPELLAAVRRTLDCVAHRGQLVLLGPSSRQIRRWLDAMPGGGSHDALPALLADLRAAGVDTIYGGDDLEVHVAAAAADFHVVVGQSLSMTSSDLCGRLIETRRRLAPTGRWTAWQPELTTGLDAVTLSSDDPTGWEAVRAVALARLALPAQVTIVAPWATFGAKTAHAATYFGASHWGLMAAGPLAAAALRLPGPDDLAELLKGSMPTSGQGTPLTPGGEPGLFHDVSC